MAYGQFYFAWAEHDETTFGPEHELFELDFSRLSLRHAENDFCMLTLRAPNPRAGLLAPGRKQFAWVAFDYGDTVGVEPIFFGRVVGVPADTSQREVEITLRARPANYADVKADLAQTLRANGPYWDDVWYRPEDRRNPDLVLQARSALWHVDRVTHELTISNNVVGEDGTLTFGQEDVLADSLRISYSGPAASVVRVRAEVNWTQRATGVIDATQNLIEAFAGAGTEDAHMISSYTGSGLVDSWPLPGDNIGGGWTVEDSDIRDGLGLWVGKTQMENQQISTWVSNWYGVFQPGDTLELQQNAQFRLSVMRPKLEARYSAERSRTEILEFELHADVQPLLSEPEDSDVIIELNLTSNDVGEYIELDDSNNAAPPIGDLRRPSFFFTDRGIQSLEYLISRARAELLDHARVVTVSATLRWDVLRELSLRKNIALVSDDIPGGFAVGKIIGYEAVVDSDDGVAYCAVTIAPTVGYGQAVTGVPGEPVYVDDDYVEENYQLHSGAEYLHDAGDVTWSEFRAAVQIDDDGIDFFTATRREMVLDAQVTKGPAEQKQIMNTTPYFSDMATAQETMRQNFTQVHVCFRPVNGGPFETPIPVEVSRLMVPMQINLEAEAA